MHRLFRAGCVLLVFTGLAHLLGRHSMVTAAPVLGPRGRQRQG